MDFSVRGTGRRVNNSSPRPAGMWSSRHSGMNEIPGSLLPTAQILEFEKTKKWTGNNRQLRGVRAPVDIDMPSIIQLVDLYERGAMALYFSLIPENKTHANPKVDAELFSKHFMIDLELDHVEEGTSVWPNRVREWLGEQLSVISNQTTHAIIAINFVDFLDKELVKAVHAVTNSVLTESRSGVFVSARD
ncbi:hypothetical protein SAMN04487913_11444 [Arthrobacter sp. ok362]|nr:hypothetical protein SAMN04487913_11444 [Arthrobacter sp. ok362]